MEYTKFLNFALTLNMATNDKSSLTHRVNTIVDIDGGYVYSFSRCTVMISFLEGCTNWTQQKVEL